MISIQKIHLLMIFSTLNPQFFRHKGHTYLLFKQLRLRLMIIFFYKRSHFTTSYR